MKKFAVLATPTVEVVPQRFVFTKVQVGTDDDRTVEIKNIGTGDLLISRTLPLSAITTPLSSASIINGHAKTQMPSV